MKHMGFILAFGVVAGSGFAESVQDVTALVAQRVALEDAAHQEQVAWQEAAAHVRQEVTLLEEEKRALEARIAEQRRSLSAAAEEDVEGAAVQQRQAKDLAAAELELAALAHLGSQWQARYLDLDIAVADNSRLARWRQGLVTAQQVLRRALRVHVGRETLTTPDGARQMDVLYLGGAQAYAVALNDQLAGHAYWTGSAWSWTWDTRWADAVRQAWRIVHEERPPAWVTLPVQVQR
jgi:hypothetical protein